jgi:hypothetical protein
LINKPTLKSLISLIPHKRKLQFIWLVVLLAIGYQAFACPCPKPSVSEAYKKSNLIFVGTPIQEDLVTHDNEGNESIIQFIDSSVNELDVVRRFTFVVEILVKGKSSQDTLFIYSSRGSCGLRFVLNEKHIIYASYGSLNLERAIWSNWRIPKAYSTNYCTRTKEFDKKEFKILQELRSK